jgi:hypothetical protein
MQGEGAEAEGVSVSSAPLQNVRLASTTRSKEKQDGERSSIEPENLKLTL